MKTLYKTNKKVLSVNTSNISTIHEPICVPQQSSPGSSNPPCHFRPHQTNHQGHETLCGFFAVICGYNKSKLVTQTHKYWGICFPKEQGTNPFTCFASDPSSHRGGIIPLLSGHCQSVATERFHAASCWSLEVRSVGMKEGGWQEYTYSLAADQWLKDRKSRGQCPLNSSMQIFPFNIEMTRLKVFSTPYLKITQKQSFFYELRLIP